MPHSYVLNRYPISKTAYDLVYNHLSPFAPDEGRFFCHILGSNLINLARADAWRGVEVELPCQVIDEHFGTGFSWQPLESAGLLTVSGFSAIHHECRSYQVKPALFEQVVALFDVPTAQACEEQLVNLFDGTPYMPRPPQYRDVEKKVVTLKWVREAAGKIATCPFNGNALDGHLATLESVVASARTPEQEKTALHRWYNDRQCAFRMKCGATPVGDNLYQYHPDYTSQYSGRISEIGGGVQSCSRAMKLAIFTGVPGIRNYDLKASQAWGLRQELEDAGLTSTWITAYLSDPDSAERRSAALGISKDAFKQCLYATIMGAQHVACRKLGQNALFDALWKESRDESAVRTLLPRVQLALAGLKSEAAAWHDWLVTSAECHHVIPKRTKRWVKNDCGMTFCLDDEKEKDRRPKGAAFILQGREAAYIHRLTLLADEHGFVAVSNQHDGLVTIGEIPTAALVEAASVSGFRHAHLEEKPTFGVTLSVAA